MEDLLRIQINQNCKLAMPEGLKDLMYDISREVLRSQPDDLLGFIADYLSTLLVTRENLCIASRLCGSVCQYLCAAGLEDELKHLGLSEEDVLTVTTTVNKHLKKANAGETFEEGNVLQKLLVNTSIPVEMIPQIQDAVRKTFLRHQSHLSAIYDSSSDEELDEVTRAVRHTMKLYRKTHLTEDQLHRTAVKIQAAYRAYGIKRQQIKTAHKWTYSNNVFVRAPAVSKEPSLAGASVVDHANENKEGKPGFQGEVSVLTDSDNNSDKTELIIRHHRLSSTAMYSVSSASLAGSFLNLPKLTPYSVHGIDPLNETEEEYEGDHIEDHKPAVAESKDHSLQHYQKKDFEEELEKVEEGLLSATDLEEEVLPEETNKKEHITTTCNDLRKLFVRRVVEEADDESDIDEDIREDNSKHFRCPEHVDHIPTDCDIDFDIEEDIESDDSD